MKAVVLLSGGLDSTTLLAALIHAGHEVRALSVLYGQRHAKEVDAAKAVANFYKAEHQVADIRSLASFFAGSALTDKAIPMPHGHYAEESMKATVVPNRNMVLLSLATAWAVSVKADLVAYAAHAGDHAIYPDCRPEFASAMATAIRLCDWHPVTLQHPFMGWAKSAIVGFGSRVLKVPFHLTWSCYHGLAEHCGECGTCVERKEAFKLADVEDPTRYVAAVQQIIRYEPADGYSAP